MVLGLSSQGKMWVGLSTAPPRGDSIRAEIKKENNEIMKKNNDLRRRNWENGGEKRDVAL